MPFFDTNILVYSQDSRDAAKRVVAQRLIEQAIADECLVVSTQVLLEFYAVAVRKKLLAPAGALEMVKAWAEHEVVQGTSERLVRALELQQSSQLSVWDALIVQAALDVGCTAIYTEDLQHGMQFGELAVVNPFLLPPEVHEAPASYRTAGRRTTTSKVRRQN